MTRQSIEAIVVDIMLDLTPGNVNAAIVALEGLGCRPRAPVPFQDLADAGKRERWVEEKGHPATEIDLFVQLPLDFSAAYRAAAQIEIAPGMRAVFVSYDDLLQWKSQAGRPQDLEDIRQLEALRRGESGE